MSEAALAEGFPIGHPVVLDPSGIGDPEPVESLIDRADLAGLRVGVGLEDPEAMVGGGELDGSGDKEARSVCRGVGDACAPFEADR